LIKTNNNKLAIIIPFYKDNFIRETLESVMNQTDKRFNLYIFNDGGKIDLKSLLKEYQQKEYLNFTYFVFPKNLGSISLTKHWERCIERVRDEDWFILLGDDDVLGNNVVSEFYEELNNFENYTSLVRFSSYILDENNTICSRIYTNPTWEKANNSYIRKLMNHTRSTLSEYIIKLSAFKKKGFRELPLAWHSDDALWLDLCEHTQQIYSINTANIGIRMSHVNISGIKTNIQQKEEASRLFFNFLINVKGDLFHRLEKQIIFYYFEGYFFSNKTSHYEQIQFFKAIRRNSNICSALKIGLRLLFHKLH